MGKREVLEQIKKYDSIVIFGHRLPDGDCYGSQIALKNIILENFKDKKVYITGSGLPAFFDYLGEMDDVSDDIIKNSLALVTDMNHPNRAEDSRIMMAKDFAKIDHHIDEMQFEGPKYVDEDSVAVCLMVLEFAREFNLKLNEKAANALFLGIVTDSGRFLYQPMEEKTFSLIASLFKDGLNTKKVYDILYSIDEGMIKYRGFMMQNYKKTPNGVIYLKVRKEVYQAFNMPFAEISNQVNVLGGIKGCKIYLLFTEHDVDGTIRVEYRSNDINVQQIAIKFGGGGHVNAAGSKVSKEDGWDKVDEIIAYCDEVAKRS